MMNPMPQMPKMAGFPSVKDTLKTPTFKEPAMAKMPKVSSPKPLNMQGQMSALAGPVLRKLYLSQRKMDRLTQPLSVNQPNTNPISPKAII